MDGSQGVRKPPRLRVTWHRCVIDGHDHAVTDEEFTFGVNRVHGRYEAVCGHLVTIDSMLLPPSAACPFCVAVVRTNARASTDHTTRVRRKAGPLRRLFRRTKTPAVSRTVPTPQRTRGGRTPTPVEVGRAPTVPASTGHHTTGVSE